MKIRFATPAVAAALLTFVALPGAKANSVVIDWNQAALEAIREVHPPPTVVARSLAITNTCLYDAWAAYDGSAIGTRLGGSLRRPPSERTKANKRKAESFAAYRCLADLFPQPAQVAEFDALMNSLGYDPADHSTDTTTPSGIGNVTSAAVIQFRHSDGANQLGDLHPGPYSDYTGYVPVNDPDHIVDPMHWQPLRVSDGQGGFVEQKFVTPQWSLVIPFALKSAAQFRPPPPEPQPSYRYREQANQILAYSAGLNDAQKVIAEYWADGPASELPPGHWNLFAQYVSQRDSYGIDQDTKLFFAQANAIFDTSIVAWDAKRVYDYVRPVTAIHYLYTGQQVLAWGGPYQGTRLIDGGTWRPYQAPTVVTPPFPEYISGHSIFSAAGAEVLRAFTGSDVFGFEVTFPAGSGRVEPGVVPAAPLTLSYPLFTDAADEAGISRRYGGIHFVEGDLYSRELGRLVADQAYAKALSYFHPQVRLHVFDLLRDVTTLNFLDKERNARQKDAADDLYALGQIR